MTTRYADPITDSEQSNMIVAQRLIEGFNNSDWDAVGARSRQQLAQRPTCRQTQVHRQFRPRDKRSYRKYR